MRSDAKICKVYSKNKIRLSIFVQFCGLTNFVQLAAIKTKRNVRVKGLLFISWIYLHFAFSWNCGFHWSILCSEFCWLWAFLSSFYDWINVISWIYFDVCVFFQFQWTFTWLPITQSRQPSIQSQENRFFALMITSLELLRGELFPKYFFAMQPVVCVASVAVLIVCEVNTEARAFNLYPTQETEASQPSCSQSYPFRTLL